MLKLKAFSSQPVPVKVELVRRSLTELGSGQRDLTEQHFAMVLALAEKSSGSRVELPNGYRVRREYEHLVFTKFSPQKSIPKIANESIELKVPGSTRFGQYLIEAVFTDANESLEHFKAEKSNFLERFDFERLQLPLLARFRQPGDKFIPLGMTAEKKVGKFLTTAKVGEELRNRLLIIEDKQKIIWLWPIRMSERAGITAGTRKILQLRITCDPSTG